MSAKINGHPTHARYESLAPLNRSCVLDTMCNSAIEKYVLFFIWTRRVCVVSVIRSGKLLFIWTEILRFEVIFIGSMDLTLISYQTIIHYTACTAHQTAASHRNKWNQFGVRACGKSFELFYYSELLALYWFIEMALIFERNANLQFSTFDWFQKIKCMIYSTCKSTDSDWSVCVYLFFVIYFPR